MNTLPQHCDHAHTNIYKQHALIAKENYYTIVFNLNDHTAVTGLLIHYWNVVCIYWIISVMHHDCISHLVAVDRTAG